MGIELANILRHQFGLKKFRPGQKTAIRSVLSGKDTVVVMPTGHGKSLIYQFAAMELEGVTVVISPLIALMKDQVDSLRDREIPATFINSSLSGEQQRKRLHALSRGKYKLVYVAPERLRFAGFRRALRMVNIAMLAVDEAHCICQWGHDFRPDYMQIAMLKEELGTPVTVALTAAATPAVRKAIVRHLRLDQPRRVITGFDRPNLEYTVKKVTHQRDKIVRRLVSQVTEGAVIVYVGTRKQAEEIAGDLLAHTSPAFVRCYHAGLEPRTREAIHNAFRAGTLPVVVATNAFGMGIDRPDVRMVIHYQMPGSLESYYQEAGRAGRDGKPARAILLYHPQDRQLQEYFIQENTPTDDELHEVADYLRGSAEFCDEIPVWRLRQQFDLPPSKLNVILAHLEAAGLVERLDDSQAVDVELDWDSESLNCQMEQIDRQRRHRTKLLDQMVAYAEADVGHREILLAHFGEIPQDKVPRPKVGQHGDERQDLAQPVPPGLTPSLAFTLQLWQSGMTIEQIADERQYVPGTIWTHLARLIERGALDLSSVVSKEVERKVRAVIRRLGDCSRLAPIKEQLPEEITFQEIRCVAAAESSPQRSQKCF